jgi:hypothetical protein
MVPEHKLHVEDSDLTATSGNEEIEMYFDLMSVSPPNGRAGSPRLRDGSHAVSGGEYNLN